MFQALFDLLKEVWFQNTLTTLVLLCFGGALAAMAGKPYWRNAATQINQNWVARLSLAVLVLFALLATMDSFVWRDVQLGNVGKITKAAEGDTYTVTIDPNRDIKAGTEATLVIGRTGRRIGTLAPFPSAVKTGDDPSTVTLKLADGDASFIAEELALIQKFDAEGSGLDVKTPVVDDKTGEAVLEHKALSLLDRVLTGLRTNREDDYSAPLASTLFQKSNIEQPDGTQKRGYKELRYPGTHLLGTAKSGDDVLFVCIKGIRTALVIGGVTTLLAIPLAMIFGILAGFFGGWVDDVVQYVYSTLSSIPSLLLIIAFMLVFGRGLPQLCIVMGITGWVGLCRLLRGETLKLREMEYVQASQSLGVPWYTVLIRHIAPNLMHLVIITFVLRFSGLVLSEAVLSYLNVGVDSSSFSWGQMIAGASSELTREPTVWWVLFGAFLFMFVLVLAANLFADAVRDALDPRLRRL